ncbi:hypothetical protein DFH27DRAFT_605493 [Peziza echinospora]|nr:hypothetical protein DFH27DRAFT_605493 [Peziza echinospora]
MKLTHAITAFTALMLSAGPGLADFIHGHNHTDRPAPLAPCGHLCLTLALEHTPCVPGDAVCHCKDKAFLSEVTECVINHGHCTTFEEELETFQFIRQLCNEFDENFPQDPVKDFDLIRTKTMTHRPPQYEPTTHKWEFTYTKTELEVETTQGPCPTTTPIQFNDARSYLFFKRQEEESTTTITTTVVVTITSTITTEITEGTIGLPVTTEDEVVSFTVSQFHEGHGNNTMTGPEPSSSVSPLCPLTITNTVKKPVVTTYFSTQTEYINATDTRAPRPTKNFDFGNGNGNGTTGAGAYSKDVDTGCVLFSVALVLIAFALQY